jgi:hypothetical protein
VEYFRAGYVAAHPPMALHRGLLRRVALAPVNDGRLAVLGLRERYYSAPTFGLGALDIRQDRAKGAVDNRYVKQHCAALDCPQSRLPSNAIAGALPVGRDKLAMRRVVFNFAEAARNDGATFLGSRNRLRGEESMPILVRRRWRRRPGRQFWAR